MGGSLVYLWAEFTYSRYRATEFLHYLVHYAGMGQPPGSLASLASRAGLE